MAKKGSKFDATPSLLGFLYQTRYALLLALRRDDPDVVVSIEKLDDISFAKDDGTGLLTAIDVRQLKHHLSRQGGLGNSSSDIWNTLRVWTDLIISKKLEPARSLLFLVTTSSATRSHAVFSLSPHAPKRDPEKARAELEAAGAASTDEKIQAAFQEFSKLSGTVKGTGTYSHYPWEYYRCLHRLHRGKDRQLKSPGATRSSPPDRGLFECLTDTDAHDGRWTGR